MPHSSGDENDSRTASVGGQRARANGSNSSSRRSSQDKKSSLSRKQRKKQKLDSDIRDFVPQGGSFSTKSLEIDSDSTSSPGSDSSSEDEDSDDSESGDEKASGIQPTVASASQPINWNKGSKSAIRTTLSSRKSQAVGGAKTTTPFEEVNGKYWRRRSASASTADGDKQLQEGVSGKSDLEEGEVESGSSSEMHLSGDSDDSESGEISEEGDDSIMLNIGSHNQKMGIDGQNDGNMSSSEDEYDPESRPIPERTQLNGSTFNAQLGVGASQTQTKEEALRSYFRKYPSAPAELADLDREDFETQAKYLFYDRDIHDIDLKLPIACTECLQEGHLAEVCPSKECVHCGVWNQHQSSFCPSWRRCQRCRERGHDAQQCSSPLRGSATEFPCDFCGSAEHVELECDIMWKFPRRNHASAPVLVSISCSHCTSNKHLVGDCPSLLNPMKSSSWTLRGLDPAIITNINSVVGVQRGGSSVTRGQRGMKIRGRADQRSPSPDSDDMMARPERRQPVGRNQNRGNIRFGSGIGRGRDLAPQDSRGPGFDPRQYRDRQEFFGNNTRQRSLSPNPRPIQGTSRGKDRWQPPPRSPPHGRPGPPRPRGAGNGGRGGGRGRGKRGGGDAYRPMPSAAKKNWDRYRF